MEYLHHYVANCDSAIHFYLAHSQTDGPQRIYFSYQDLVRNVGDGTSQVYCFDGAGRKKAEFFVFRGLKGEIVISNDPSLQKAS